MKHILILIALVAPLALTACKSKGPDIPVSQQEALERSKAPVNLLNTDLKGKVASDFSEITTNDQGHSVVAVNLRNRTSDRLHIQARAVFKDEQGISTGDETAWKSLFLEPQQSTTYRATSTSPGAELATVEVRKQKP